MIINLGFGALVIAFILSLYGIFAAIYGVQTKKTAWTESARLATLLIFVLISISALSIIYSLATSHYELDYVSSVTSNSMPMYLKITAWWGGQAGSLVFWSWLLSIFTAAVMLRNWDRDREFLPWVIVVSLFTLAFFLMLSVFFENPFSRLWALPSGQVVDSMFSPVNARLYTPSDGRGLNPLLRHPGMIIHPPMLYLGFVAFVIPYAFAIAALVTNRTDDRWIRITRRWTLIAWLFLSLGLILGMRWAYDVLGWGGYWGWDPVEISALLPWLTGTAFLHSVMIQEKRGMMKHWNMVLIILTYALVIFGTFLTRSGVLSSVHAFAASAIGPLFFAFIGITFVISLSLLIKRWDSLKSKGHLRSLLSREALFLANNMLFMGVLVVSFWGVIFPLLSELATGQKVTVGPPFYERANGPIFAALMFLMGIAPLSAWGYSTIKTIERAAWRPFIFSFIAPLLAFLIGLRNPLALLAFWLCGFVVSVIFYEFWRGTAARHRRAGESIPVALWRLIGRNRRRYGGYIIHLGVVLMAIGIIGIEFFQTETQGTLAIGDQISLAGYDLTFKSLNVFDTSDGRNVARAVITVSKNGRYLGEIYPRRDFYFESQQPMTIPGLHSTMQDDLYVVLVDWEPVSAMGATFKIYHNPLVNWLWLGGFTFFFGTLIAAWPDKEKKRAHSKVSQASYLAAKA
jgi:cytochrome c-type biogenesis protein CcmF